MKQKKLEMLGFKMTMIQLPLARLNEAGQLEQSDPIMSESIKRQELRLLIKRQRLKWGGGCIKGQFFLTVNHAKLL